jgi:sec-independent protein translocase protein TatA
MAGLGWQELVIVLVIIMIIFGAGKLPEVARSLGQGVKEFKSEANQPVGPTSTASPATSGAAATTATAADAAAAPGTVVEEKVYPAEPAASGTGTRADQI